MTQYVFRIDDVAPNMGWDRMAALEAVFRSYDVRPLIGVIPDNRDPVLLALPLFEGNFWDQVRSWVAAGWEVALHGYQHRLDSPSGGILGLNGRGEFAGLDLEVQWDKIRRGLAILDDQGISTRVFMPPAHSFDRATLRALASLGMRSVTDGYALYPYRQEGMVLVPQLLATPRVMPFGVHTFCLHPNLMSNAQIQGIDSFLQRNAQSVVPFSQVADNVHSRLWQAPVGWLLKQSLRTVRMIRSSA